MASLPKILLVPVDGSEGANSAAAWAARLAARLEVPVRLLFAFPESALELYGVPAETLQPEELQYYSPERFAELRERRARQVFDAAREAAGDPAVTIEERLLTGDAGEAILAHAADTDAALIVMGRRGLSRVSELLLGSVSSRITHHAPCPVMLVP